MSPMIKSQPLYLQVEEILLQRIGDATWGPGTLLPNEQALAEEFGVSHGTIRKALDNIEKKGLIIRQQGRGTSVATHANSHERGQFFALYGANGEKLLPQSDALNVETGTASIEEQSRLNLSEGAEVLRMIRNRVLDGTFFARETIVVPVDLFPGLGGTRGGNSREIPNFLYPHFHATYGVLVAHAEEQVSATVADAAFAASTGVAPGTPILRLDRRAFDLEGAPVEWRIRECDLKDGYYRADLKL